MFSFTHFVKQNMYFLQNKERRRLARGISADVFISCSVEFLWNFFGISTDVLQYMLQHCHTPGRHRTAVMYPYWPTLTSLGHTP